MKNPFHTILQLRSAQPQRTPADGTSFPTLPQVMLTVGARINALFALFCIMLILLPRPAHADSFTIDISPLIDWISSSSISLDHDAAGNFYFTGPSFWQTTNETGNLTFDGNLSYVGIGGGIGDTTLNPTAFGAGGLTGDGDIVVTTNTPHLAFSLLVSERRIINEDNELQFVEINGIHTSGDGDPIPEPSTMLLMATGLLGLAGYRWYQRRREGTQVG